MQPADSLSEVLCCKSQVPELFKRGFEEDPQCPLEHPVHQTSPNSSSWCEILSLFYTMHKGGMRVSAFISCCALKPTSHNDVGCV